MSEKHLHHQTRGSTHSAIRAHRRRGYLGPNPSYEAQECLSETYTLDMFLSQPTNQRRRWHPTPALLPGKSHGWRSLVGCSPGGCKESDTTEQPHFHFSFSCIGEGNGNPLQSSCLENPRDGRAWWAAVYGVTQSQTRLKRLSSSSQQTC